MESGEPLKVLIVGAGKGGTALINLLTRAAGVEVAGVVDRNLHAPGLRLARRLNIPTADNVAELIACDGAHLIVDVTGDAGMPSQIEAAHGSNVEMMSGKAARLLWTLVQEEQELRAQLMQADKLATLGTFAAQIAHDLKNPLYCIREFAQFIEEELDPSRIKEYSQEILNLNRFSLPTFSIRRSKWLDSRRSVMRSKSCASISLSPRCMRIPRNCSKCSST